MSGTKEFAGRLQAAAGLQSEGRRHLIGNVVTPVPGAVVLELWLDTAKWELIATAQCGCQVRVALKPIVEQLVQQVCDHGDSLGGSRA